MGGAPKENSRVEMKLKIHISVCFSNIIKNIAFVIFEILKEA